MGAEWMSEADYLVRERAAQYRSEYRQGRLVTMTGASRSHNRIVVNFAREFGNQIGDRPCEVFVNDMRVKVGAARLYAYPDVVALCGPPEFEDAETDTLLNPAVIVEVLSSSTEGYDRGEKFVQYRQLPSLREFVLIAQDRMRVERWQREGEAWRRTELTEPDARLELTSIDCALLLRNIFRRVELADGGETSGRAG